MPRYLNISLFSFLVIEMKKKILLAIIGFIIITNAVFYAISITTDASLILKIRQTDEVFIFAHGQYANFTDLPLSFWLFCKNLPFKWGKILWKNVCRIVPTVTMHLTRIDGEHIPTYLLLDEMRNEGYKKIWISMCGQGNYDYVIDFGDGTRIEWGDDVSRIETPGSIYPVYWGLGIHRFVFQ